MQGYVLFTAPAHFLIIALFISLLQKEQFKHWFFKLLIAAFFILAVRYTFERVKPFKADYKKITYTENIKKLPQKLPKKSVIFNTALAVEVRFFTDFPAYEKVPKQEEIDVFLEKGFEVFVVKKENLSNDFLKKEGVGFLSIDFKK